MFLLVQRTDTLPEMRAVINTDHIIAVMPVAGGVKTKLYLSNGDTWDIALVFTRAIALFHADTESATGG